MQKELGKPLNLQNHDEIVASVPPEKAYEYALFITTMLEQPREYFGNVLRVPAVVTVGKDWGSGEEFKFFPSKKAFNEVLYEKILASA
jgi:DNA polymerase I-like protein with 3'-5' exonuclease and polymerase domains